MKPTILIAVIITLGLLTLSIILIVDLHRASESEVVNRFHDHQSMIVRQLTREIERYLRARSRGVQVLSMFASIQHRDMKKMAADIQEYFAYVKKDFVKAISVYDEKGTIIYSTTQEAIGRNYANSDFFQWATKKENPPQAGKQFISSLIRAAKNQTERVPYLHVLIATPIYQETRDPRHSEPTHKFVGVFTCTVALDEVTGAFLQLASPSTDTRHIWIMDTHGTVLLQTEHPEEVLKSVRRQDSTCMRCHSSFDYVETVLAEKQGTIEYAQKGQPTKAAAFAPLTFENAAWIIVFNVPLSEVSGFVDRQLERTFFLIGVIAVALVSSSVLIYRSNRQKIRAQEETKQWREKRELEDRIRESEERYRTMVETAHDMVWTLDSRGNFTYINNRSEEITGHNISDLLGKSFIPLILSEDLPKVQKVFLQTLQGTPQSYEVRVYDIKGKIIVLSVNIVPLHKGDIIIGTVSFGRDVTEQKLAEQASRQAEETMRRKDKHHRLVIENILRFVPEGLLVFSRTLCLMKHNKAFEDIVQKYAAPLGCTEQELTEKIIEQAHSNIENVDSREIHIWRKDQSRTGALKADERNELVLEFNAARIFLAEEEEEEEASIVVSLKDVTDRKRAAQELQRRNRELSVLHAIDRAVNQTLDLDEILNVAVEKTMEVLDADAGGIYLLQEDGKTMLLVVHRGISDELVKHVEKIQLGEGISGRAAAERKPVIMDIAQYPSSRLAPFIMKEGVQSLVSVPLLAKDRALGSINVASRKPNAFSEDKIQTLLSIGIQIGVAVQNAELFKAEQRRATQLLAINKISQNIAAFMDVEKLFSRVVKLIQETFGYSYVTLAVVDEKENEIIYTAAAGYDVAELKEPRQKPEGAGIVRWVASSGQSLLTNDVSTEPRFLYCDVLKVTRSELAVPIMVGNKIVAVLDIQSDKLNAFRTDDLTTFETVTYDIGIAMEEARLYEELRGTSNYLENLITYANASIIVWNPERKITLFNRAFEKLSGYRSDEVIGCDLERLFPATEKEEILKTIHQAIKGERWETVEMSIQRKDGERRIALWNSGSITDKEGNIIATIAQGQDITERKRAEEEISTLAHALRSISECVSITDMDDTVLFVNEAFLKTYGYDEDELVGRHISIVRSPNNLPEVVREIHPATLSGGWHGELLNQKKDGNEFSIFLSTSIVHDDKGRPVALIGVAADITERKRAEEALWESKHSFHQSEKLAFTGRVAANIAHEVRNPLANVSMSVQQIKKTINSKGLWSKHIEIIERNVERINFLVTELLNSARPTKLNPQTHNIHNLLEEVLHSNKTRINLQRIKLIKTFASREFMLKIDKEQMFRAFTNIINNAIEAMTHGGTLTICTELIDSYIAVKIKDTGKGIPEGDILRIFDPFFSTKTKGVGLGLMICHGIIVSHGGTIEVESKPRKGSVFTVSLPIKQRLTNKGMMVNTASGNLW